MQVAADKPKEDLRRVPLPIDIARRDMLYPRKFAAPIIEYQRKSKVPKISVSKNESSLLIDALAYEYDEYKTPNSSSLPSDDQPSSSKSLSISSVDMNESKVDVQNKFVDLFRI